VIGHAALFSSSGKMSPELTINKQAVLSRGNSAMPYLFAYDYYLRWSAVTLSLLIVLEPDYVLIYKWRVTHPTSITPEISG